MKTILITGGFGFIGTHLIEELLNYEQYKIIVIDNLLEQVHGKNPNNKFLNDVEFYKEDIRNKTILEEAIKKSNIIIHLAADTGTGQSESEIHRYTDNNICGTAIILDILNNKEHNVEKLILASSRAVYGEGMGKKEEDLLQPKSIYGITKRVQEDLIINSCPINYTILRFQNVFGDGQSLKNPYTGILSIFSKKLLKNETIEIFDNNEATRDFVYVKDVVKTIELCILNDISNGKTYNVGTSEQKTILDIAKNLKRELESSGETKVTNFHRKGDVLNVSADITKIKEELNWTPVTSFENGIQNFVKWIKNTPKKNYYIVGKKTKEGNLESDSEKGVLSEYFELGWEYLVSHLYIKNLYCSNKLGSEDVIVTIKDRMFLYEGFWNNVISYDDFLKLNNKTNIIDICNQIQINPSLFIPTAKNGKYIHLDTNEETIKNIKYANIGHLNVEKEFCCLHIRYRKWAPYRNLSEQFWIDTIEKIKGSGMIIYIFGKEAKKFSDNENVIHVNLDEYASLLNNKNCKFLIGSMSGGTLVSQLFSHENCKNYVIISDKQTYEEFLTQNEYRAFYHIEEFNFSNAPIVYVSFLDSIKNEKLISKENLLLEL